MVFVLKTEYDSRQLACQLSPRPEIKAKKGRKGRPPLTPELHVPCPFLSESLVYGVCRCISKSPRLTAQLVPLSYRLRFARSKQQVRPRFWFVLRPCHLGWDAPGVCLYVQVSVSAPGGHGGPHRGAEPVRPGSPLSPPIKRKGAPRSRRLPAVAGGLRHCRDPGRITGNTDRTGPAVDKYPLCRVCLRQL